MIVFNGENDHVLKSVQGAARWDLSGMTLPGTCLRGGRAVTIGFLPVRVSASRQHLPLLSLTPPSTSF